MLQPCLFCQSSKSHLLPCQKYCVEDARKISSEIYLSFTHSVVYLSLTQQLNPKDMVNNKTDSVKILTKVINKLYDNIYHQRNQIMESCSMKNLSMMSVDIRKISLILTLSMIAQTSSFRNSLTVQVSIKICGKSCKLFLLYLMVRSKLKGDLA